eukprot:CAMPEP_0179455134 /NCGR_PEP_ID=MMETSP0799-20121207/39154_1 /TAXON_ID=46947 /ORGANISM="Geminigera cryophila, Strain CCMP2564" /LENGTH=62 /DNA_ID=CAMNT_0021254021 /DNA_START=1056 /DNA_END=1244 /DNA_ORIENTATION=+
MKLVLGRRGGPTVQEDTRCVARRVDPDVPAPDNPSPPLFLSATPASDPPPLAAYYSSERNSR